MKRVKKTCLIVLAAGTVLLTASSSVGKDTRVGQSEDRATARSRCDQGKVDFCLVFGDMCINGKGGPKNEVLARQYYQRACKGDSAEGCLRYSEMLAAGKGGPPDPANARQVFSEMCRQGDQIACLRLAETIKRARSVVRDVSRDIDYLALTCERGNAEVCGLLVGIDPENAGKYKMKACELGKTHFCSKGPVEAKITGAISVMAPEVDGSLDSGKIASVVRSRIRSVQDCYEKEIKNNPDLSGKITIRFTIGEDGKVIEARVESDSMGNPAVADCILSRLRHWRFPKAEGGSVTVSYPFVFRQKGVTGRRGEPAPRWFQSRTRMPQLCTELAGKVRSWCEEMEQRTQRILKLQADLDTRLNHLEAQYAAESTIESQRFLNKDKMEEIKKERHDLREKAYESEKTQLKMSYERAIRDFESDARRQRSDCLGWFEQKLAGKPYSEVFGPHELLFFSEVLFSNNTELYLDEKEAFDKALREFEEGKRTTEPAEPAKELGKVVSIYRAIMSQFPTYRHLDLVHYLLAYALEEQEKGLEAKDTYHHLVLKYPGSRLAVESWLRIGEYFFHKISPRDLDGALSAYQKAAMDRVHPFYQFALFMLAWTHYLKNDMPSAAKHFADLVEYYDEANKQDAKTFIALRSEAIRYLSLIFADADWNGVGVEKAKAFFKARGDPRYQRELFMDLGTVFFDSEGLVVDNRSNYLNAIAAYKHVIALDPYDAEAPRIQDKIVDAYARGERNFEAATDERTVLANTYGEGSAWWKNNENKPEAKQNVQALIERNLYTAALFNHQQASTMRQNDKIEEAIKYFKAAALSYGHYLKKFPHSKNAYELSYYYADCLFFSNQFEQAALEYEKIRDSDIQGKHAEDATLSAAWAWDKEIEKQIKNGRLEALRIVASKDRKEGDRISPKSMAPIRQRFVAACKLLMHRYPTHKNTGRFTYAVGLLYYQHDDFPTARQYFTDMIERYPNDQVAEDAANLLVETYISHKDWAALADRVEWILRKGAWGEKFVREMGHLEAGAIFNDAFRLFNEKRFLDAADRYIALVDRQPTSEHADKALNNAAIAYKKIHRFAAASKTYYRLLTEYPMSALTEHALFWSAFTLDEGYQFEQGLEKYQLLIMKYPQSSDWQLALNNAALLQRDLGDYSSAARYFIRIADSYSDDEEAAGALWKAVLAFEKAKDWKNVVKTSEQYKKRYGSAPKHSSKVVECVLKIAEANEALGNRQKAQKGYSDVLEEYSRRNLHEKTRAAYAAATAAFRRAEALFDKFDAIKLRGTGKILKRDLERKAKMEIDVARAYDAVLQYKQADWTLAALYRKGLAKQRFAEALFEATVPKEIKTDNEKESYRRDLDEIAGPILDAAVALYTTAKKTADETGVVNEWTFRIDESLHKLAPIRHPAPRKCDFDLAGALQEMGKGKDFDPRREIKRARGSRAKDELSIQTKTDLAIAYLAQGRYEIVRKIIDNIKAAGSPSQVVATLEQYLQAASEGAPIPACMPPREPKRPAPAVGPGSQRGVDDESK